MALIVKERRGERHPFKTLINIKQAEQDGNRICPALTHDISLYGISIFSSAILQLNTHVDVWLTNHEDDSQIQITGEVRWVHVEDVYGDSSYWLKAGIAWDNLDEQTRINIEKILDSGPPSSTVELKKPSPEPAS